MPPFLLLYHETFSDLLRKSYILKISSSVSHFFHSILAIFSVGCTRSGTIITFIPARYADSIFDCECKIKSTNHSIEQLKYEKGILETVLEYNNELQEMRGIIIKKYGEKNYEEFLKLLEKLRNEREN